MDKGKDEKEAPKTVHSAAAKGFAGAANYHKVRPDYTRELAEHFLRKLHLLGGDGKPTGQGSDVVTVLELGSGTGKFTSVMLDVLKGASVRVIASDPLENMCSQFKELLPEVEFMQCSAQSIDLPSASVDFVVAVQSFHWFASSEALAEIKRVLVPGGRLGILLIAGDMSEEWSKEIWSYLSSLYRQHSVPFPLHDDWRNVLLSSHWFTEHVEDKSFRLVQDSSVEGAFRTHASGSLIASGSDQVKAAFKKKFDEVIGIHFSEKGRELRYMPYGVTIWCCTAKK